MTETLGYYTYSNNTKTSGQVSTHNIVAQNYSSATAYTYDANGNIATVKSSNKTIKYTYDTVNQLIREDNPVANKTWIWTYDDAGNISSCTEYAYTLTASPTGGTTTIYAYNNSSWGDLLTSYQVGDNAAVTITSDSIGNMTSDGTRTYTWEHGRELLTLTKDGITWTNTYNADGLRTKRTNGTTTYSYVYNGSSLSQMSVGTNLLNFVYDASGSPMAVVYNGTTYYYVTNLQGDVVAILDSTGADMVKYTYNAWGQLLTTTGTMATTLGVHNPLRYRGYVYDSESSLYYLQSRYYDPALGRFINADALITTGQGILGNNMFAYCNNSPIIYRDTQGTSIQPTTVYISDCSFINRDVTDEIMIALSAAAENASSKRYSADLDAEQRLAVEASIYIEFYNLVDHKAPWDIKREQPWENTIGTPYPGYGEVVILDGKAMTPESLGNFTYGYLGYFYGIPLAVLKAGSYYAAGFPTNGPALKNEIWDWDYIAMGYDYAKNKHTGGM